LRGNDLGKAGFPLLRMSRVAIDLTVCYGPETIL
jgi:hypothetical protein